MALKKCPECGRKVSPNAEACPDCGEPLGAGIYERNRTRAGRIYKTIGSWAAIVGIIWIVAVIGNTSANANILSREWQDIFFSSTIGMLLLLGGIVIFIIGRFKQ